MPRILVVDDDPDILNSMVNLIKKHGYQVDSATDGLEALKKVHDRRPDLVLTDVLMPNMDGYKFYKELKRHDETADTPVLVITGRGQMEDSFQVAGVDGFITKPFTTEELFLEIEDIFAISVTRAKLLRNDPHTRRKKILVLSDHKLVLENMIEQARRIGYYLEAASVSSTLVSQVMKSVPDIVLIDLKIQDMNPIKLLDVLKHLPQTEGKKILVFISNPGLKNIPLTDPEQALGKQAVEAGATKFIGPYTQRTFLRAVLDVFDIPH